jgi:hypothetical protein
VVQETTNEKKSANASSRMDLGFSGLGLAVMISSPRDAYSRAS